MAFQDPGGAQSLFQRKPGKGARATPHYGYLVCPNLRATTDLSGNPLALCAWIPRPQYAYRMCWQKAPSRLGKRMCGNGWKHGARVASSRTEQKKAVVRLEESIQVSILDASTVELAISLPAGVLNRLALLKGAIVVYTWPPSLVF